MHAVSGDCGHLLPQGCVLNHPDDPLRQRTGVWGAHEPTTCRLNCLRRTADSRDYLGGSARQALEDRVWEVVATGDEEAHVDAIPKSCASGVCVDAPHRDGVPATPIRHRTISRTEDVDPRGSCRPQEPDELVKHSLQQPWCLAEDKAHGHARHVPWGAGLAEQLWAYAVGDDLARIVLGYTESHDLALKPPRGGNEQRV